jgi:hypothetical protein
MLSLIFGGENKTKNPDVVRYNPARDLAYNFRPMANQAARLLAERPWLEKAWLAGVEANLDVSAASAFQAMQRMVALVNVETDASPSELAEKSGWLDHPAPARLLVLAALGQIVLGGICRAIRDLTPAGAASCESDADRFAEAAFVIADLAAQPAWRRWLLIRAPLWLRRPARRRYRRVMETVLGRRLRADWPVEEAS